MQRTFKILIVDDTAKNIQVVASVLKVQGYELAFATNGYKAITAVEENEYDLILLDVMMPGIDGYETCQQIKKIPKAAHIPIIFLTAKNDEESIIMGLDSGGVDYVTKPFNRRELLARVETHLKLKDYEDNLEEKVKKLTSEIEATQREVVFTMGAIGEARSKETGNHVKRVAEYSYIFGINLGLSTKQALLLKEASPMHDIGKVAIPDAILHKQGKLDSDEWEIMKTHAQLGYDMLRFSEQPLLKAAATIALNHHEKYDGSGYPQGLSGEDIPVFGRVIAICDVFDALGSKRCYKDAWDDDKIFEFIKNESGKMFDPQLVKIFFSHLNQFLSIRHKLRDD